MCSRLLETPKYTRWEGSRFVIRLTMDESGPRAPGSVRPPREFAHSRVLRNESRRREWPEVVIWLLSADHLCHHVSRDGSQQDSISIVSGRREIAGGLRRTKYRQIVRRSRTQSRPIFQNPCLSQLRHQADCASQQSLDSLNIRA